MEQAETVVDRDAEIRKLLEERREERRQKLLARLGRNLSNPPNVSSWEALTGTLKNKKAPTNINLVKPKETVSIKQENAAKPKKVSSWEALKGSLRNKTTVKAIPVQANEGVPAKLHATTKPEKGLSVKRTLSFGQTATSLKRTNIANNGATLKRSTSFKSIPTSTKKPVAPQVSQATHVQKQKLTVPCSPNFSNRTRQPAAAIKPQSVTATKSAMVCKLPSSNVPKQFSHIASSSPKTVDNTAHVGAVTKRKSSSWMVPLTPERKGSPSKAVSSTQHTPNIKPFVRKSFSEARAVPIRSTQINRSVSTVSMNRPPSTLPRKSVAPNTLGKDSNRRSVWSISKEPSEKEKIQQWLEKRGRSVASCRHLGCLGHELKDFKVPDQKSSNVNKNLRINGPPVDKSIVNDANEYGSPQLKRKSSVMNTTFEKENEEERMLTPPPPPDFDNNVVEDEEQSPPNSSVLNVTFEKEDDNHEDHDLPSVQQAIEGDVAILQIEEADKFHTPPTENKRDSTLDLTDLKEGRVEALMETISALFQEPVYPEAKIESWLNQSEAAFPAVKATALYWDIKARLEERRGNTMEALDIYSQALESKTESLDTMKQFFDNFLLRIGSNMPTGQRTPLLKSLGLETPMIRQSRRLTSRRPLLDSAQAFNSTTVKYELKLKQVFDTVDQQLQENNSPTRKKKAMKTPMKFNAASNTVSVASEGPFQLLATPVRRSMRPKSGRSMVTLDEQTFYVTDLDQLSPTTKSKAVLRENKALASDL
ncbi:uncharacterized protein LOC130696584 [Daphnia carinata]|uniref:uncharacterized protein LOC130696584 n=1 Tax=Daphnia carinata TaxID=120202 RepID=UPI00257CFCA3|nr:uncharacterized protein LOC130696584 [Daphnia carinata]